MSIPGPLRNEINFVESEFQLLVLCNSHPRAKFRDTCFFSIDESPSSFFNFSVGG
jgi:hypothetical protein